MPHAKVLPDLGWASEHQIEVDERGYDDLDETICTSHIEDPFLRAAAGEANVNECSFCEKVDDAAAPFAIPLQQLMPHFMTAFWNSYGRLDSASVFDGEYVGVTDTDFAVWDVGADAFETEVADSVLGAIIEAIVDSEVNSWFGVTSTDDLEYAWSRFSETAKHISRFVVPQDRSNRSPMAGVVGFLDELTVYVDGTLDLVQPLPPGTRLYRGRLVADASGPLPDTAKELGPAPRDRASSNRMSPAGVPLFYASEDAETAVAEIAFHGIQPFAVVGAFATVEELQILDLTLLPEPISPFDLERLREARMRAFLEDFVAEITRPIVPDGRQHVEYAPTQVLTEYLRWRPTRPIDGIAIPSAQTGRRTYVLFLDAVAGNSEEEPWQFATALTFESTLQLDPDVELYRVNRSASLSPAGSKRGGDWFMQPSSAID